MGIFDWFNKRNKNEEYDSSHTHQLADGSRGAANVNGNGEEGSKIDESELLSEERVIARMTEDMKGALIYGDTLNRVSDYNIENGTFVIPEHVRNIETYAFRNCKDLIEITIPRTVEHIGIATFEDCANLTTVNYLAQSPNICSWRFKNCVKLKNNVL